MLTSEQSIVEYRAGRALPDRLTRNANRHYVDYARRMIAVYRDGLGRQRRWLHRRVEAIFAAEPDCPPRRIQAFCKILDDHASFRTDPFGNASRLRLKVFSMAARFHPLVERADRLFEHEQAVIKSRIAERLGISWDQVEQSLYADVLDFQRLEAFDAAIEPTDLLSRYNVAQLQACLYRAVSVTVLAEDNLKTIIRYAKLARLLHEITRLGPSKYRIEFSGPASLLRQTRRYGVNFARFLPVLLACRGWEMTATLKTPWNKRARLTISWRDGFRSHLPAPQEFDSHLEEAFAKKFGPSRRGWQLIREGEILHDRQKTFVPDFTFRHEDGTEVLLEIVGFWTPEYLAAKRNTLQRFRDRKVLIAVPEKSIRPGAGLAENILVYKTALKLEPVLKALENARMKLRSRTPQEGRRSGPNHSGTAGRKSPRHARLQGLQATHAGEKQQRQL